MTTFIVVGDADAGAGGEANCNASIRAGARGGRGQFLCNRVVATQTGRGGSPGSLMAP